VSPWWRKVAKIRDGVGEAHGGWFAGRVSKVLGDGTNTFFWFDRWLGDVPLCMRFARLFDLATNKLSTVADMCTLGWGKRERRGVGGEGCGHGRKTCEGSIMTLSLLIYIILISSKKNIYNDKYFF